MVTSDKAAFNIQWKKVNQRTPTSMSWCPLSKLSEKMSRTHTQKKPITYCNDKSLLSLPLK